MQPTKPVTGPVGALEIRVNFHKKFAFPATFPAPIIARKRITWVSKMMIFGQANFTLSFFLTTSSTQVLTPKFLINFGVYDAVRLIINFYQVL